ncbi:hypothetical protein MTR67_002339 [Solanum verrucosum]|uniref:Integrase catalytic domain-containing protein n=1 Tax=Solanum verrucosum TaxID=315347 RepID=A0AAF0PPX5_SOLVR|nr:hypothetical protein MTR67_002339 [Solanum verrucosum]
MPIPTWKWEWITMDFFVGLPTTMGGYDSIWVADYRLAKSSHFISVRVKYTTKKIVELYISQIVRLHGVQVSIKSDRGSLFISHFWKALLHGLGTQLDMSMTFHPQTDEFSYNNSYHSSIQMAPFDALYGIRCRSLIGWFNLMEMDCLDTNLLRNGMEQVCMIQYRLLTTQSRQKSYADRRVRALVFMKGDHVWLRVSPTKGVMRFVHPVIHISMLGKYIPDESHVLSLDLVELGPNLTFEEEPIAILDRQVRKLRNKEISLVKM